GLTTLLLGINASARFATGNYIALLPLAAAVASLCGFVWWEGRAPQPIVRIDLFRARGVTAINLVNALVDLCPFSVVLFVPCFLVQVRAMKLWLAGLVLAGSWVTTALTSPLAGRLIARIPAERVAAFGLLLAAAGLFSTGGWPADVTPPMMLLTLAIQGIGV